MDLKLKNKYAFITASSSGIGFETAKAYLEEGANVIINGRDRQKLNASINLLKGSYPSADISGVCLDLTEKPQGLRDMINAPSLDILVLNQGSGKRLKDDLSVEEWERLFDINLYASINVVNQLLGMMKEKGGSVIFISSIAALEKAPAPYGYSASKLGVISLAKNLSYDLARHNIRVNCVVPGNIYFDGGRWQEILAENPQIKEQYIDKEVPMKRFGTPEEIASSVVFLSSDKSSFTTGAALIVDGGQTRRIL